CDASGTLTFRRPVEGFSIPKFGAACPIWPLFQALSRPMHTVCQLLEQAGTRQSRFAALAIAQPEPAATLRDPQLFEATMLLVPDDPRSNLSRALFSGTHEMLNVGSGCRVCPQHECPARREPSILPDS
ncbi:MAG TPA: transcriptional regulator, partial [Rhodobacteraceae bacterium]|nr:transcriptional regulator [Paracoccaceae bacterium]